MRVESYGPRTGTFREWMLERPYAVMTGILLLGLFLGSLVSQFVTQRQIAQDLERLGERWRIADRSLQQLTSTRPTVDRAESLLVSLQQAERQLQASVRAVDGLRSLTDDLAVVRRQVAAASQQVHQIDGLVDTIETQSVRTLGTMQGTIQHLHVLEGLASQNGQLLPTLEQSLASYLDLVRSLQRHEGDLIETRQGLDQMLAKQRQVELLLQEWQGKVAAVEASLRSGVRESDGSHSEAVSVAEQGSQAQQTLEQTLEQTSAERERAQRRLRAAVDVVETTEQHPAGSVAGGRDRTSALPIANRELLSEETAGLLGGTEARTELLEAAHRATPSPSHVGSSVLDCADAHTSSLETSGESEGAGGRTARASSRRDRAVR